MLKEDKLCYEDIVKTMSWDDLAETIMDLEILIFELKNHNLPREIKLNKKILKICEEEKTKRTKIVVLNLNLYDLEYGVDYQARWSDEYFDLI